jgi:hypothetical protein
MALGSALVDRKNDQEGFVVDVVSGWARNDRMGMGAGSSGASWGQAVPAQSPQDPTV